MTDKTIRLPLSILPDDAVIQIRVADLVRLIAENSTMAEENDAKSEISHPNYDYRLDRPLTSLDYGHTTPYRAFNGLSDKGITNLRDVLKAGRMEILRTRGVGNCFFL